MVADVNVYYEYVPLIIHRVYNIIILSKCYNFLLLPEYKKTFDIIVQLYVYYFFYVRTFQPFKNYYP